jgi:hypothetical protein
MAANYEDFQRYRNNAEDSPHLFATLLENVPIKATNTTIFQPNGQIPLSINSRETMLATTAMIERL